MLASRHGGALAEARTKRESGGRDRGSHAYPSTLPPWWQPIPEEMRQARRWLVWRLEQVGKRWTKKPYQPNGRLASSTNPRTWSAFETCVPLVPKFTGIGFVLGGSWCCIDLDHCRDAQDEGVEPWALDVLHQLRALGHYIEVSPSGQGIHSFFRGKLPAGRRKRGNVEVYDSGRYMTVTGRGLDWDTL